MGENIIDNIIEEGRRMFENETIADIIAEMRFHGRQNIDAAHRHECGNAAKLREALEAIVDCGRRYDCDIQHCPYWDGSEGASYLGEAVDIARAALAAPPRNCDVGTAEEQRKRFGEFCQSHSWHEIDGEHCRASCPLYHGDKAPCDELEWAQMPYESEAAK